LNCVVDKVCGCDYTKPFYDEYFKEDYAQETAIIDFQVEGTKSVQSKEGSIEEFLEGVQDDEQKRAPQGRQ